jgi:hypothetical protein
MTLIFISILITIVWDYLNYPNELASLIMDKLTNGRIKTVYLDKPLGCSLCVTTIISWVYLAFSCITWTSFTSIVYYTLLAVINGCMTKYIFYIIILIDKTIDKIMIFIERLLK